MREEDFSFFISMIFVDFPMALGSFEQDVRARHGVQPRFCDQRLVICNSILMIKKLSMINSFILISSPLLYYPLCSHLVNIVCFIVAY